MNTQYPPCQFIVKDLIPAQGFILFAGMPKAGKSLFIVLLLLSVSGNASTFLKHTIQMHVKVLYLCLEDTASRLKERMTKMGLEPTENFLISNEWEPVAKGGITKLINFLKMSPDVKLIVIDTKGKFFAGNENENFQRDYDDMAKLKEICDKMNVAIILVTHLRKKPFVEDEFESVSGSVGNTAAPDTVMMLKRARNQNKGELYLTSRDYQERKLDIYLDNRTLTWKAAGADTAKIENLTSKREKIITAMYELGGKATPLQISEKIGGTAKNISNLLTTMSKFGFVDPSEKNDGVWKLGSNALSYFEGGTENE